MKKVTHQRVYDYIKTHPEEFDMDQWVNPCGTTACYAGHALLMAGFTHTHIDDMFESDIVWEALDLLEMDASSEPLFYLHQWPYELRGMYKVRPVEALCRAIEHFTKEKIKP